MKPWLDKLLRAEFDKRHLITCAWCGSVDKLYSIGIKEGVAAVVQPGEAQWMECQNHARAKTPIPHWVRDDTRPHRSDRSRAGQASAEALCTLLRRYLWTAVCSAASRWQLRRALRRIRGRVGRVPVVRSSSRRIHPTLAAHMTRDQHTLDAILFAESSARGSCCSWCAAPITAGIEQRFRSFMDSTRTGYTAKTTTCRRCFTLGRVGWPPVHVYLEAKLKGACDEPSL